LLDLQESTPRPRRSRDHDTTCTTEDCLFIGVGRFVVSAKQRDLDPRAREFGAGMHAFGPPRNAVAARLPTHVLQFHLEAPPPVFEGIETRRAVRPLPRPLQTEEQAVTALADGNEVPVDGPHFQERFCTRLAGRNLKAGSRRPTARAERGPGHHRIDVTSPRRKSKTALVDPCVSVQLEPIGWVVVRITGEDQQRSIGRRRTCSFQE